MKYRSLLLFFLFLSMGALAQDFSNKGKDFWLGYGFHVQMGAGANLPSNSQDMVLYFTSDKNATVTVEIPGVGFTQTYQVLANQVTATTPLPKTGAQDSRIADTGFYNRGIHVYSNVDIVAYAHIYNGSISGACLLYPTNTLGNNYYSIVYNQSANQSFSNSFAFVVAVEDGTTTVEITPADATRNRPSNAPFQVTLTKGQVYSLMGTTTGNRGSDLTGTRIRTISSSGACKKIAVFCGSGKMSIGAPNTNPTLNNNQTGSADNIIAQCTPSNAWGRKYLTTPTGTLVSGQINLNTNYYRICVSDPNTQVKLNGSVIPSNLLHRNFFYEVKNTTPLTIPGNGIGVANSGTTNFNVIESDKPITVAQYCTTQGQDGNPNPGDPEMIYLSPVEQTINKITLNSTPFNAITQHAINVIIKKTGVPSFRLDGTARTTSFVDHPKDPEYAYAIFSVSSGSHTVYSDSGFNAIAYGFGNAESYGYNAGTNIIDLNPPVKVQNEFGDASLNFSATCVNSPFRINLSLTYEPSQIVIDLLGTSNLTAGNNKITLNPTKADSTYSSNGKNFYYYKGPEIYRFNAPGTYAVKVTTTTNLPQSDGCSSTNEQEITDNILVNEAPVAALTLNYNGCRTEAVNFTDQSDGKGRAIVRWLWNFSDGSTSTLQNPAKIFGSSGNFSAKLTAITDFGCIGEITKDISLSDKATPAFSIPDTTCAGNNLIFKNQSTAPTGTTMSKWTWVIDTFATKINSTNEDIGQQFIQTGKYQIKLMVESSTGCKSDTLTKQFFVRPYPKVGLVLPDFCLAEGSARFIDTSKIEDGSEADFKYEWQFNLTNTSPAPNLSVSNNKSPDVIYYNVGIYKTQLKLISKYGCIDSASGDFTVNGSRPKADFLVLRPDSTCSNLQAKILHTSSVDFGNVTKTELIWDLVDSSASRLLDETPTTNKIYLKKYANFQQPSFRNFQVRLVAYSGNASVCRDSVVRVVKVNQSPKVAFSRMPGICLDATPRQISQASELGNVPGTFVFSGKGASAGGVFNPSLSDTGTFSIQYLYRTALGCEDSASMPITVWPSPKAKFGVTAPFCEKNNIIFKDSSKANYSKIVQWNWNFRDGDLRQRTDSLPFNKRYDTAGLYPVLLRVTTDSGCVSPNDTLSIRVTHLPLVNFTLPNGICLPDGRGTFISSSTIPDGSEALFSYRWNFGDPSDPTPGLLAQMIHRYTSLGNKLVQLKITTKDGCIDSLTKSLNNIYPPPSARFSLSSPEVCREGSIQFTDQSSSNSGAVVKWHWYLGSNDSSFIKNPAKQFNDSGNFTIRLFVFDDKGCVSDTSSQQLVVHPYPVLQMTNNLRVLEGGTIKIKPYYFGSQLQFSWTPALYLDSADIGQPSSTPPDDITYRLTLTGIGGCTVSDTVFIKVLKSPLVPNAFSPNGDGINDTWRIQYLESYPGATIEVFNRYGQKVFESTGYTTEWDGYFNGSLLPIGTYYYIINPRNGRKTITGAVTIIR
ncbi:MAG: PKD domain-containing protein [Sediminibacterium sp.]